MRSGDYEVPGWCRIYMGDCRQRLLELPAQSVQCVVTSPPYWGLRKYGERDVLGQERVPDCLTHQCGECYICHLLQVFAQVRRVLRDDGVVFVVIDDTALKGHEPCVSSYWKKKDFAAVPWRLGLALHEQGWYLRGEIIWEKPYSPDSTRDRPGRCHEYVLLLSKSELYYWNQSIRLPAEAAGTAEKDGARSKRLSATHNAGLKSKRERSATRNLSSVWRVSSLTKNISHIAVMPVELAKRCIELGTSVSCCGECGNPDGLICRCLRGVRGPCTVLDPFLGSGTTAVAALELGRRVVGIEYNRKYKEQIEARIKGALAAIPELRGVVRKRKVVPVKGGLL